MPPNPTDFIPLMGMITGIVMMVLIGVTVVKVANSAIGQALGRRIHGKPMPDPELLLEVSELRDQVAGLEQRLGEAEERLDFAERLLASGSSADRAGPGRLAPHSEFGEHPDRP